MGGKSFSSSSYPCAAMYFSALFEWCKLKRLKQKNTHENNESLNVKQKKIYSDVGFSNLNFFASSSPMFEKEICFVIFIFF